MSAPNPLGPTSTAVRPPLPRPAAVPPRVPFAGLLASSLRSPLAPVLPRASALASAPATASASAFAHASAAAAPPAAPRAHQRSSKDEGDLLDPSARTAAQLAPPPGVAPRAETSAPQAASEARATLDELLPAVVRRIAWSGDARRGTVRIEIGAGELEGARILVHAEDGRVRVEMQVPPGADAAAWRARIEARFRARGIATDSVEVQ
jgi:hypothetical protein